MSKRVSPAERLRVQIDEVFAGGQDLARAIEEVARLGAQLLLQCAVEAEVAAFLGRNRYARLADVADARQGMRNGYPRPRSRPPRVRLHCSGPSYATPPNGSPPSCSARE